MIFEAFLTSVVDTGLLVSQVLLWGSSLWSGLHAPQVVGGVFTFSLTLFDMLRDSPPCPPKPTLSSSPQMCLYIYKRDPAQGSGSPVAWWSIFTSLSLAMGFTNSLVPSSLPQISCLCNNHFAGPLGLGGSL